MRAWVLVVFIVIGYCVAHFRLEQLFYQFSSDLLAASQKQQFLLSGIVIALLFVALVLPFERVANAEREKVRTCAFEIWLLKKELSI